MKKTVIVLLLIAVLSALFALCTYAEDGISYTLSSDGKYYILSSYTKNEPEVKIASEYKGLPVKKVAAGAFSGNVSTYKVIIPKSVTEIGDGAFSAMPSLYEFEASGSYTAVDGILFSADKKTLVRYPQARTGEYTVPANVRIGAHSFSGCLLTYVDASGAQSVGEYAFYAAEVKDTVFSSSLSSIGAHAFEKSRIEKLVLPGVTSVSEYAFSSCEYLVYADISKASLNGDGVFYKDTSLLSVSFPENQTDIPKLTFAGCTSLVTAPIGKSVTAVGEKAFYGCVSLKHASCGAASCASDAFGLCDRLYTDKKPFSAIGLKSAAVSLKVNESYAPELEGCDLFTVSHNVSINNGVITALFEGKADVYAVSRAGGDCCLLEITVSNGKAFAESAHPYEKGTQRYTYTVPGKPERICVTFSPSDTTSAGDAIKIYDKNNNLYGTFYRSELAGKTLLIDGDTVNITLVSVTGGCYGFRIVNAVSVSSLSAMEKIDVPAAVVLKEGESAMLTPKITPSNAFPDELIYVTDNKNIAYVTGDGTVHAVSAGTTDITVYSSFYGVSAKCTVSVSDAGDGFEYTVSGGKAYITSYKGSGGVCVIPKTIDGYTVCGIKDGALSYCGITELQIPETVTYIAPSSLDGNSLLSAISAPEDSNTFKTVNGTLYSKNGKTLVRVPCGIKGAFTVPDSVVTVSDGAFSCCFGIESVTLGASVKELTGKAFINCSNLKNVSSKSGNFTAVDGVLYTKDKKTLVYFPAASGINAYSVEAGTEKIGAEAFDSAVNLTSIVLPASVTEIDGTALRGAVNVSTVTVNKSNTVYTYSAGALYENGDLKFVPKNTAGSFSVKSGASKILPYALYGCAYVTDVVFPDGIEEIGDLSFAYCGSLDVLYLPQSVNSVGYDAFSGDSGLSVYIPDGAAVSYLSDCLVMCGKNTPASEYCEESGFEYIYMYRSDHGDYTVYTPVKAQLRVTGDKDPVLLSKYASAAGQNVRAYSVELISDGAVLPAGEYALFKNNASDTSYYYENGELSKIGADAFSVYRRCSEHIIEPYGEKFSAALTVRTMPDKLKYSVFDVFDVKGMTLYYTDAYGITTVVDRGYSVSCDLNTPGEKTVTVKYSGLSTGFTVHVEGTSLSGTVTITGSARYGATLTADITDVKPANTALYYQWYKNGAKITGATEKTYKPDKSDIGAKLTVKVSSATGLTGEITSAAVTVEKAASPAPPKPEIESTDANKVTLKPVSGCEYRLSTSGDFKDSNVFDGLIPGETYIFCQRYKETETTAASDISSVSFKLPVPDKIISEKYFVNRASGAVSLIEPLTTVRSMRGGFENGDDLIVYRDGKQLSDGDTVGTGCVINLVINGTVCDSCTVVITGDVNGDGKITITDYLKIKDHIQNGTALSKEKMNSSDVNGDGKVTITDYLRLKYCIQNNIKPEQNRY